jgi:hypothetical protein
MAIFSIKGQNVDMVTNLKKLSEALDAAAPGAKLAAAVRAEKVRIEKEIREKGSSSIVVGGRTFKVSRDTAA